MTWIPRVSPAAIVGYPLLIDGFLQSLLELLDCWVGAREQTYSLSSSREVGQFVETEFVGSR